MDIPTQVWVALLNMVPSLLWALLMVVVIAVFYGPIRHDLLPKITGFKAFGMMEVTFIQDQFQKATPEKNLNISSAAGSMVLKRLQFDADILRGSQILWVDDQPENNRYVRNILRPFGVMFDMAFSTEEALSMLPRRDYDIVISDMARPEATDAGLRLLSEIRTRRYEVPVVYYVGRVSRDKQVPQGAAGITDRPDELIMLVLNSLEIVRVVGGST